MRWVARIVLVLASDLSLPVLMLGTPLVTACAREALEQPPSAPGSTPATEQAAPATARELSELDALEHDLEVSEQRLQRHLAQVDAAAIPSDDEESSPVVTESEASERAEPSAGADATRDRQGAAPPVPAPAPAPRGAAKQQGPTRADDVCVLSCRALASMRRAAEGICKLVEGAPRCVSATWRVERAAARVRDAGCVCDE